MNECVENATKKSRNVRRMFKDITRMTFNGERKKETGCKRERERERKKERKKEGDRAR